MTVRRSPRKRGEASRANGKSKRGGRGSDMKTPGAEASTSEDEMAKAKKVEVKRIDY